MYILNTFYIYDIQSTQGIEQLQREHADINIYVAAIDETLDVNG
jgi:uracil phosphoribosyltransferase